MLTIEQIMNSADTLIPNAVDEIQKLLWLTEINQEFFESVKVPHTEVFPYGSYVDFYVMPTGVRKRNINVVQFGSLYDSEPKPGRNAWIYDETSRELKLIPPPLTDGVGFVHYYQVATLTYTSVNKGSTTPEAAPEYHWIYTLGLCERIAKTMEDIVRSNNFAKEYQNGLQLAAQNYGGGQRAN